MVALGNGMEKDLDLNLADCVGAIYEAAANAGDWLDVGKRICAITKAQRATFSLADERGVFHNVLRNVDESEILYATYYHTVDPYRERARRDYASERTRHLCLAKVGGELVPEAELLRTEYYVDYARLYERRHMMGGMIGVAGATPIGIFRACDAQPFEEYDCNLLESLLPYLQRAIELRSRLGSELDSAWATRGALDALPTSVIIVDADMRVVFANSAGSQRLAGKGSGLRLVRSGPRAGGGTYLAARQRSNDAVLRRHVARAAAGQAGGALRTANDDASMYAVLVSPLPRSLSVDDPRGEHIGMARGLALVLIQDLESKRCARTDLLCDVFGFSFAEAEVAAALFGGVSTEEVAHRRNVSLNTVRSQIRSILEKAGAHNLRDLERTIAALADMAR